MLGEAISFNLFYERKEGSGTAQDEMEAGERGDPIFRSIEIVGVVCTGAKMALLINGLPEMPLEQLYVHKVTAAADRGVVCHYAKQLVLEQMDLHVKDGSLITLHQCEQVELIRLQEAGAAADKRNVHITGARSAAAMPFVKNSQTPEGNHNNEKDATAISRLDRRLRKRLLPKSDFIRGLFGPGYCSGRERLLHDSLELRQHAWFTDSALERFGELDAIGHAIDQLPDGFEGRVRHGEGVWAPSIRHHDGNVLYLFRCSGRGDIHDDCAKPGRALVTFTSSEGRKGLDRSLPVLG